jgi:hypothetical protein
MDKDDIKSLLLLQVLAVLGIVIPILVWPINNLIAVLIVLVWWFTPGAPIPVIHSFMHGWMPFIGAYPVALKWSIESMVER